MKALINIIVLSLIANSINACGVKGVPSPPKDPPFISKPPKKFNNNKELPKQKDVLSQPMDELTEKSGNSNEW